MKITTIKLSQAGNDWSEIQQALEICKAINNDNIACVMCKGYSEDYNNYTGIYYDDYEEEICTGELGEILAEYTDFELWLTTYESNQPQSLKKKNFKSRLLKEINRVKGIYKALDRAIELCDHEPDRFTTFMGKNKILKQNGLHSLERLELEINRDFYDGYKNGLFFALTELPTIEKQAKT